jgi:hypothetical protein
MLNVVHEFLKPFRHLLPLLFVSPSTERTKSTPPPQTIPSTQSVAGDLIFYTFNPNVFSHNETLPHKPIIQNSPEITLVDEKSPTLNTAEAKDTEKVDGSDEAATAMTMAVKNNPEPDFVKRVIKEVLGDDVSDLKILVLIVVDLMGY